VIQKFYRSIERIDSESKISIHSNERMNSEFGSKISTPYRTGKSIETKISYNNNYYQNFDYLKHRNKKNPYIKNNSEENILKIAGQLIMDDQNCNKKYELDTSQKKINNIEYQNTKKFNYNKYNNRNQYNNIYNNHRYNNQDNNNYNNQYNNMYKNQYNNYINNLYSNDNSNLYNNYNGNLYKNYNNNLYNNYNGNIYNNYNSNINNNYNSIQYNNYSSNKYKKIHNSNIKIKNKRHY